MNVKRCTITEILKQIDRDVTYFMPDELKIAMSRSKSVVRRLVKNRDMTVSQYDQIRDELYSRFMADTAVAYRVSRFEVLDRVMERKRKETNNGVVFHKTGVPSERQSIESAIDKFFKIDII